MITSGITDLSLPADNSLIEIVYGSSLSTSSLSAMMMNDIQLTALPDKRDLRWLTHWKITETRQDLFK